MMLNITWINNLKSIIKPEYKLHDTPHFETILNSKFEFFHDCADEKDLSMRGIQNAKTITDDDAQFTEPFDYPSSAFSSKNNFLSSCIRISR